MEAAKNVLKMHEREAVESEKAILSVCISDNKVIPLASNLIRKEFFYESKNGIIWTTLCKIYNREGAVDQIMLTEVMKAQNTVDGIGGVLYFAELTTK